MKRALICGMLLGLLPGLAFAQRGRMAGGVSSGARLGPSATVGNVGPMSPNARINPNAISLGHDGVSPNARPIGSQTKTVTPSATNSKTAHTVGADPQTVPDRVQLPDARPIGGETGVGPDQ